MAFETNPTNAFDLVIRVGFFGDLKARVRWLEHFQQKGTVEVRLTPFGTDPKVSDLKRPMIVTHVGVDDPLDIEGSVIL